MFFLENERKEKKKEKLTKQRDEINRKEYEKSSFDGEKKRKRERGTGYDRKGTTRRVHYDAN